MKKAIASLFFAAASTSATIAPNNDGDGIHRVGVSCKGMDMESMSAKALSYAAKALEETYNTLHGATDNKAAHIVANGPMSGSKVASKLRGSSPSDELAFTMVGGNTCRLCRNDDAAATMIRQSEWEVEFAAVLAKAPYEALSTVKDCKIDFVSEDESTKAIVHSNFDIEKQSAVVVNVQCDQTDLADLSVQSLAKASKALKDTYNAIHRAIDGDGSSLESVQLEGPRVFSGLDTVVKGNTCRLCRNDDVLSDRNLVFTAVHLGGNTCRLCRNDDSLATVEEDVERTMAVWEELFVASLHTDASFMDVGTCKITISSATQAS